MQGDRRATIPAPRISYRHRSPRVLDLFSLTANSQPPSVVPDVPASRYPDSIMAQSLAAPRCIDCAFLVPHARLGNKL
jgi:hypothetical protein